MSGHHVSVSDADRRSPQDRRGPCSGSEPRFFALDETRQSAGRLLEEPTAADPDVRRAMERLKALHEGYAGVTDAVACGVHAIPHLSALLHAPESSGIFEPRCRAIAALAGLGASGALIEFLSSRRDIADPAARAGEEAVISTAARALSGVRDERVLPLLLQLAKRQPLSGVIEALSSFRRSEAIPGLINGLYEDYSRRAAEMGLRRLGRPACAALLSVATTSPFAGGEHGSSLRARRSATALLADIGIAPSQRSAVYPLVWDADPEISVHACRAYLSTRARQDGRRIIERLVALLPRLRWVALRAAKDAIRERAELAPDLAADALRPARPTPSEPAPRPRIRRPLAWRRDRATK